MFLVILRKDGEGGEIQFMVAAEQCSLAYQNRVAVGDALVFTPMGYLVSHIYKLDTIYQDAREENDAKS